MKNRLINNLIICVLIVLLAGCRDRHDPETLAINNINAKRPEFVADTPAGKLYRIWVDMGSLHHDRVYYFDTNNTVSINNTHNIQSGKTTQSITETVVVIDGKKYLLKEVK